jgi:hypothetical protein
LLLRFKVAVGVIDVQRGEWIPDGGGKVSGNDTQFPFGFAEVWLWISLHPAQRSSRRYFGCNALG